MFKIGKGKNKIEKKLKKRLEKYGKVKTYKDKIICEITQKEYDKRFKNDNICMYHLENSPSFSYVFKNIQFDKPVCITGDNPTIYFENCNFFHGFKVNSSNIDNTISFLACNFIEDEKSKKMSDCQLDFSAKNVKFKNCQIFVSEFFRKKDFSNKFQININSKKVQMENCKIKIAEKVRIPLLIKADCFKMEKVRIEVEEFYIDANSIQTHENNRIVARSGMIIENENYDFTGEVVSSNFIYNGFRFSTFKTTITKEDNALFQIRKKILYQLKNIKNQLEVENSIQRPILVKKNNL